MHSFNGIARELIVKIHTHVSYFTDRNRVMVQTMRGELIVGRERSYQVIPLAGLAEKRLVPAPGRIVGTGPVLRQPASRIVRWL